MDASCAKFEGQYVLSQQIEIFRTKVFNISGQKKTKKKVVQDFFPEESAQVYLLKHM